MTGTGGATPGAGRVVLVTGPPRAGVTAMVTELRRRMPSHRFAESADAAVEGPDAVVFVVSAVAPMTESDCASADLVAETTDAVIAVVSKIDDHRDWHRVLAADRELLGGHGARLRRVPWVGAAPAPRLGEPHVDELVDLLDAQLRDPTLDERNRLRAAESHICRLRAGRERLVLRRRLATPERAASSRATVQQARLALTHAARRRCASLRTELLDAAAAARRPEIASFPEQVRRRCAEVSAAVEADLAAHTAEAAEVVAVPPIGAADPPLNSRRLETQLMTVLGAGFGLGVALVVTRVLAGVAPGLSVAALAVGAVVGLATTGWVVRARALLHDRAVLQAWVGDMVVAVRAAAEERVATGMLTVEAATLAANAAAGAAEDAAIGAQIAALDAEIRALAHPRQGRIGPR